MPVYDTDAPAVNMPSVIPAPERARLERFIATAASRRDPWEGLESFHRDDDSWWQWPGAGIMFAGRSRCDIVDGEIACTAWPIERRAYAAFHRMGAQRRPFSNLFILPLDCDPRSLARALRVGRFMIHRSVLQQMRGVR
jgi:hypothetical protein